MFILLWVLSKNLASYQTPGMYSNDIRCQTSIYDLIIYETVKYGFRPGDGIDTMWDILLNNIFLLLDKVQILVFHLGKIPEIQVNV